MQISAIVPILLNILLSEQQNQKQARPEQTAFREVMQAQLTRPSSTANPETATAAPQHRAGEGGDPVLTPLPLRSPLFPDTQFYAFRRRDEEKQGRKGEKGETGIVFSLGTVSLGRLFFMLVRKAEAVSITCHTEDRAVAGRLNTRAEELKKQVRDIGFEQVTFRCTILDPNLVKPTAGFSSPGLLDLKV